MNYFNQWLEQLDAMIWGPILLALLLGTGVYFTIILKGLQFRKLGHAMRLVVTPTSGKGKGDVSPFQALTTALAGTVGTGNIAGVATAVAIGGVGAVFWMWVSGLVGMVTTYAESTLAVRFRRMNKRKEMAGGPMYYIAEGIGWKWLAGLYCIFGIMASLGIGNVVQAHSIADVMHSNFGIPPIWSGVVLAWIIAMIIIGGIKSIGRVTSYAVPAMALFYIVGGLIVIGVNFREIPSAFGLIFSSAFTGQAAVGGFIGSTAMRAVRMGISRGAFSNEAGLGSTSIAAAAARTDTPTRQALISMVGTFFDTLVVCTITGLVIATTGAVAMTDPEGTPLTGPSLTAYAFSTVLPGGNYLVAIGLVLFASTTILAWTYYGEKFLEYLVGSRSWFVYRVFFVLILVSGALLPVETVWTFADIANGLMAFPNLFALLLLSGIVVSETKLYLARQS